MTQDCFPIWDLTTDCAVKTTSVRINRLPLSRARGSGDEEYLLTLPPSETTTVSTRFARGNEDLRPLSKAEAEQEREEAERSGTARRSIFACGVDGLEPGHRYSVSVAKGKLISFWWVWGTKDDLLVDSESREWGLDNIQAEEAPLEIDEIAGVEFDIEQ
ncbi:MAG: hypothetical protein LQ339_004186 [Xanthoria mediterranea]|nr:MAG: hypothetical protein LQ339_004186 [Xanthoria mediterranea]